MVTLEYVLTKALTTLPAIGVVSTLNISPAAAQDAYDSSIIYQPEPVARLGVLGVNVVGNSLICGIMAAAEGRDVPKDVVQCFGGATLQYLGMEIGAHDVPVLPGFGLRMVETGTSVIENTLAGREPFEQLQYELGPMLYQINFKEKEVDVYWRASPIVGLIYFAAQGYDLSWPETFSRQAFVFHSSVILEDENVETVVYNTGLTIGNIMAYNPRFPDVAAHEFMHILQYTKFRPAQFVVQQLDLKPLHFIENTLRYRLAEDLVSGFFWGAGELGCASVDYSAACNRRWWNLLEAEAYLMQTAHEGYTGNYKKTQIE